MRKREGHLAELAAEGARVGADEAGELHRDRGRARDDAPMGDAPNVARTTERTSTPGWLRKRASSAARMARSSAMGLTTSRWSQRARTPSLLRTSRRRCPSRSTNDDRAAGARTRSSSGSGVQAAATISASAPAREHKQDRERSLQPFRSLPPSLPVLP